MANAMRSQFSFSSLAFGLSLCMRRQRKNWRRLLYVLLLLFSLYFIHKLPWGQTQQIEKRSSRPPLPVGGWLRVCHIIVAYFRADRRTEKIHTHTRPYTDTAGSMHRNLYNLLLNYLAVKALNNLCSPSPKLCSHAPRHSTGGAAYICVCVCVCVGQHESVISLKLNLFLCQIEFNSINY